MSRIETYIKKWLQNRTQTQIRGGFALGRGLLVIILSVPLAAGLRNQSAAEPVPKSETKPELLGWITPKTPSDALRQSTEDAEAAGPEDSIELTETGDLEDFAASMEETENFPETGSETEETTAKPTAQKTQISGSGQSSGKILLNTGSSDLIWGYLKLNGWTDTAIAGVLGNFHQESGLDPGKVESNGVGYGLGQWSYSRRVGLESYAARRNLPVNDLFMQLDYLMVEAGESQFVQNYMKTDFPSVEAAVRSWNNNWERPNRRKAHLEDVRIPYAEGYYYYYTGKSESVSNYQIMYSADNTVTKVDESKKTGLVSDGQGWRYRYSNGKYAYGVWKLVDGKRCFFGLDGYLVPELTEVVSASDATMQDAFSGSRISE